MVEFSLTAEPFTGYFDQTSKNVKLREIFDMAVVSLAIPLGETLIAEKTLKSAFGMAIPDIGLSFLSNKKNVRIVRLSIDQAFVIFPRALHETGAAHYITDIVKGKFYVTDQSDVWVMFEISGKGVRRALERICTLNLGPTAFEINAAARTSMEYLGTIIIRNDKDSFLLMSASSSANSFLNAVEKSIENTA